MEGVLQHAPIHKPMELSLQVSSRQSKEHYTNNHAAETGWITNCGPKRNLKIHV
jgi:hypothetical protein